MNTHKPAEQINNTSEKLKKLTCLMERLNFHSDEKSTLCGRELHTHALCSWTRLLSVEYKVLAVPVSSVLNLLARLMHISVSSKDWWVTGQTHTLWLITEGWCQLMHALTESISSSTSNSFIRQVVKELRREAASHVVPLLRTEWSLLLRTSQLWRDQQTNRQTDRHTERRRYSVCSNRPHLAIAAMRHNKFKERAHSYNLLNITLVFVKHFHLW